MKHGSTVDPKPGFGAMAEVTLGEEVAQKRFVVELGGIREQEVLGMGAQRCKRCYGLLCCELLTGFAG